MLKDILDFRRAVRYYASTPISEEKVQECLKLATLAPTTYNMQLYEVYHITDKELLKKLGHACLDYSAANGSIRCPTRQTPSARQEGSRV